MNDKKRLAIVFVLAALGIFAIWWIFIATPASAAPARTSVPTQIAHVTKDACFGFLFGNRDKRQDRRQSRRVGQAQPK